MVVCHSHSQKNYIFPLRFHFIINKLFIAYTGSYNANVKPAVLPFVETTSSTQYLKYRYIGNPTSFSQFFFYFNYNIFIIHVPIERVYSKFSSYKMQEYVLIARPHHPHGQIEIHEFINTPILWPYANPHNNTRNRTISTFYIII